MKELNIQEYKGYLPVCNTCTPFPDESLKEALGEVVWDWREYSFLGNHLNTGCVWTVLDKGDEYHILAGIFQNQKESVGFILTECPYKGYEVGNLQLIIKK